MDDILDILDNGEEERDALILDLIQDENSFSHLLHALESKTTVTLQSVRLVITQCRDCNGFPSVFIQWIKRQCQPFIAYSVQDRPENLPSQSQSLPSNSITNNGINNVDNSATNATTSAVKASAKTKKRVTPNTISNSLDSPLQGNIASIPSSEPMGLDSSERGIKNKISFTNTPLISVNNVESKGNLIATESVIGGNEVLDGSVASFNVKNTKKRDTSKENKTPNSPYSVEIPLKGGTAVQKIPDMKRSTRYSVELIPSSTCDDSPKQRQTIERMSALFMSLIVNQYISFSDSIPLIAKLCSLSLPGPKEGFQLAVTVADSNSFPTLLHSSELFHLFIVRTIKGLVPILNILGERIALSFAESSILRRYSPSIVSELVGAAEDAKSGEVIEDINFSLPDNFIRPFREEIDSRNEYRTQVEAAAYNERERCFDDFSNLLHDFQIINRSDVDGSKTSIFWNSTFIVAGNKMMDLRDCNYVWFANIFMQMLLFHGLNTTSGTASGPRISSNTEASPEEHEGRKKGIVKSEGYSNISKSTHDVKGDGLMSKQRMLEERMGSGGNGYQNGVRRPLQPNRSNKQQQPQSAASKAPIDSYQDPALHFFGNQQFFFRFIVHLDNHRFCRCLEDVISSEIASLSVEPKAPSNVPLHVRKRRGSSSSSGPGEASGIAASPSAPSPRSRVTSFSIDGDDIFSSSSSSSSKFATRDDRAEAYIEGLGDYNIPGNQSFALRIVKLRILGKFLGLLNFWPQWSLSVSTGETGPLALLATTAAGIRGSLRLAAAYPLRNILEHAWSSGRLSYTVPWITEFLKMMIWDCTYLQPTNPYRDVFGLLLSMQQSDQLHPIKGKVSSNRLYVLIEIQNLWATLPLNNLRRIPLPITKERSTKQYYMTEENSKVDDHNAAFSRSFLHHVTGFLDESVNASRKRLRLNLAQRAPIASRSKNNIPLSSRSSEVKLLVPKRQTLSIVSAPTTISSEGSISWPPLPPAESRGTIQNSSPSSNIPRSCISSKSKTKDCRASSDKIAEIGLVTEIDAPITSASNLEPRANVATSLMAQFAAVDAVKHQVTSIPLTIDARMVNNCGDLFDTNQVDTNSPKIMMRVEPRQRSESLKGTSIEFSDEIPQANGRILTPNREKLLTSGSISVTASKTLKSRAPFSLSTPDLFRSVQPVVSPMGGYKNSTPLSTAASMSTMTTPHDSSSLVERLEVAFWQQHPQLQHMSSFLLEQLQKASLASLRDRVAASVRLLWSQSAILRTESEKSVRATLQGDFAVFTTSDLDKDNLIMKVNSITSSFTSNIEVTRDRIHALTATEGQSFLETFIESHMSVALPELCALHPCHARVTFLSVWLIRKQASAQRGPLMRFLSSYARRKLGEVSSISAKQFKKSMDALIISVEAKDDSLSGFKNDKMNQKEVVNPSDLKTLTSINEVSVKNDVEENCLPMNSMKCLQPSSRECRRRKEVSSCFIELSLFFSVQDDVDKQIPEITPISFDYFMTKGKKFNCFDALQKGSIHGSESLNFPGSLDETKSDGLLTAVEFQNKVVRMCEAIHGLVEAVAACVGDLMEEIEDELLLTESNSTVIPISKPSLQPPSGRIPTTSWAAIASQKTAGEKNISLEQEQVQTLSDTDVLITIENMRTLMVSMIYWAAGEKEKGDLDSKGCSEAAGKLSIQIVKMMTLCLPSLLYIDSFLRRETNQNELRNRVSSPFCSCMTKCLNNHSSMNWDKFISLEDPSSLIKLECQYPSDILILAEAVNLVTQESLTFIIVASARPSTLAYYTSCKNLPLLKKKLPTMLICLIGRCFLYSYHIANRSLMNPDSLVNQKDSLVGTKVIFDGLCESSSEWYKDFSSQDTIRMYLNPEILNIIVKLSK